MHFHPLLFLTSFWLFAESVGCVSNEQLRRRELKIPTIDASRRSSSSPHHLDDIKCAHVNSIFHIPPLRKEEDDQLNSLQHKAHKLQGRLLEGEPPLDPYMEDDASTNGESLEAVESKQGPWPFELSDIPLDPSITYGELDNGLRYFIMPNSEPPGQMELRLHIDAGANFEKDEADGLAHFLEHMMFQTTKSHPNGDLIPSLQRLGIGFGIHLNAYTTFDETVYFLSLPNLENDTLATSLGWMRDVMDGALLEESEIEAERGVVVSELEYGDSVDYRLAKMMYQWLLPDHLISKRFVIGTEETIMGFTKDMFDRYYQEYYVPRRATLIAVGDFNVSDIVTRIEDHFGSVKDSGDRGDPVDYGSVPLGQGLRTNVFVDDEVSMDQLVMNFNRAYEFIPDTEEQRIKDMKTNIANSILSKRFDAIALEANSTIQWGYAYYTHLYDSLESGEVGVSPRTGLWQEGFIMMAQEFRRAIEYGFTEFEVETAKTDILIEYRKAVLEKVARSSSSLADTLVWSVNGGIVVSTPEEDLRIAELALDSITPEILHEVFRNVWNTTDINIYLFTNGINGTTEDAAKELARLFLDIQDAPIDPPVDEDQTIFSYTDFGPPGVVVEDSLVSDLGIRQMKLSNGVRVNLKQTDFEPGSVYFVARFGNGQLQQPKNATYLDSFASFMLSYGGLGNHTYSEIENVLSGRTVVFSAYVGEGYFSMDGNANSDDLELALQVITAHFVDPAFGKEALGLWDSQIPDTLRSMKDSLWATWTYDLFVFLRGGDQRFIAPTEEELYAFEASDARDWLTPFLDSSYLEFSIIGDFDENATVAMILDTIGALPKRDDAPAEITSEKRFIDIPTAPQTKSFTYQSKIPTAGAYVVWETPSLVDRNIERSRHFEVLAEVFSDRIRVKIREEMGGSYSPYASYFSSTEFDYGFFVASAEGVPEEVEVFTDIILSIAANISTGDITQDEFDRAILPIKSQLEVTRRDNMYWLYEVMDGSQAYPDQLDWCRGQFESYEAMTVNEINSMAIEYLSPDAALQLSIYAVNGTNDE